MPALERGFTLPEVMLALTFGSLIMLAAAKTYPVLRQHSVDVGRHYRLESVLRQLAFGIEKDLRRTGFCAGNCRGRALLIGHAPGEAVGSCVIMAYDITRNGRWETLGADAGYFGYRLRQGALEGQRGVTHCHGTGWERLLDNDEVRIETFSVKSVAGSSGKTWVMLSLAGRSKADDAIRRNLYWAINMASLP
ncbi:prepilin peptidase-dependent protein [Serratia plymuthica]|uniref:Prepilin peptidase-dependent protein n=1 Tax=Serratia plymuthica TaxID=82996 RepID=A0A2X4V9P3_SERPL|nr:prepilin peptidase-dependent protein [Serratia plymuthica]QPS19371.1 prepilin peptidase-dependent protein [Serratia plymuthica]QPS56916.1 prepilin peptidase-dependent protein [Serratia plymuthica]QPS61083.1 prepilin peptidase-dependent protein [Serratia plymuthica]RKS61854.1 prepilin peptidase dependent protein B [Serratia plymuthica]UNK29136.1 prepilin peptidase-dependent protein [Serratia plymuthica]